MRYLLFVVCIVVVHVGYGQDLLLSSKSKKAIELYLQADNFRVRGQYNQAEELLKQALEKDKAFEEAYFRLAQVMDRKEQAEDAIRYFEEGRALAIPTRLSPYDYELTRLNLRKGAYEKALNYGQQFLTRSPNTNQAPQVRLWVEQCMFAIDNIKNPLTVLSAPLSDTVNRFPMQYFPVLTADESTLVFTMRSGRGPQDDENLVVSNKVKGKWTLPISLSPSINTAYREGTCSISADGRHLVFARCGPQGCDLYETFKVGDDWSDVYNLGSAINTKGWEVQPSLSSDGRELYFVSDRPGGMGGYDIWFSVKNESGIWQPARNAGRSINTPYDEISPQLHASGLILYFASNGKPGFGGQDLYYATRKYKQPWSGPVNLGYPINDHAEQFAFFVSRKGKQAFYTVSGATRKDGSRIFEATLPEQVRPAFSALTVNGVVRSKTTNQPLRATVELADLATQQVIAQYTSDSVTGQYIFVLPEAGDFAVYVQREGYLFESLHFTITGKDKDIQKDCYLQPIASKAGITLSNVFFETDSYALSDKSRSELDKLAALLKSNPTVKIEIQGHTDNIGAESYNQQLSLKRAESVIEFLVNRGVEKMRCSAKGLGSTKPVAPNDIEINRQRNRRIEARIP